MSELPTKSTKCHDGAGHERVRLVAAADQQPVSRPTSWRTLLLPSRVVCCLRRVTGSVNSTCRLGESEPPSQQADLDSCPEPLNPVASPSDASSPNDSKPARPVTGAVTVPQGDLHTEKSGSDAPARSISVPAV